MFKILLPAILFLAPLHGQEAVVANGKKPEGTPMTLEFTEDLRINSDSGQETHIWVGLNLTFNVSDQGHILIVEPSGNRILEFDGDGNFVKLVGKEGQGPDEFRALQSMSIFQDQTAVAFENLGAVKRLTFFDKDFKYIKRDSIQGTGTFMRTAYLSPDGKLIASFYLTQDQEAPSRPDEGPPIVVHTGLLGLDTKPVLELSKEKMFFFNQAKAEDKNWWARYLAQWTKLAANGMGVVAFGSDGSIFTAVTDKYEIIKWTPDMKMLMTVTREYEPISQSTEQIMAFAEPMRERVLGNLPPQVRLIVTDEVARKSLEIAELPPRKPPVFGILPMDDGGFLVVHDYNPLTQVTSADLFNKSGKFLGSTSLPKITVSIFGGLLGAPLNMIFAKDHAYVMELNEDDEPSLVRYRYKIKPAK